MPRRSPRPTLPTPRGLDGPQVMSVPELATALDVGASTIYRHFAEHGHYGPFVPVRVGRSIRVGRAAVERALARTAAGEDAPAIPAAD